MNDDPPPIHAMWKAFWILLAVLVYTFFMSVMADDGHWMPWVIGWLLPLGAWLVIVFLKGIDTFTNKP